MRYTQLSSEKAQDVPRYIETLFQVSFKFYRWVILN